MTNLLANWGFEGNGHGEWTRATHTGEEFDNWFTPEGFVGWWDPRQARPEAHVIPFEPPYVGPPARVYEGHYAVKIHKSFEPWTGGHYQIVEGLDVGQHYLTGFMAHSWCNHDGLPHAGDPNCAPMGCDIIWCPEEFLPPLNGDPVNDAWWAALFQVGVQFLEPGQQPDPTNNVEWGQAAAIYNGYHPPPPLGFDALKPRAVVFLRAALRWGYRNNDAYMDGAFLHVDEDPPPTHRYERTYVLLPDMKPFDPGEQARISALHPGQTVGPSADDAFINHPYLDLRHVIAYKPQTWPGGKTGLEEFGQRLYDFPGANGSIEYREEPPPPNPWLLGQRDPLWADAPFGDANCHSAVGQQGCFITTLGMAQRFYDINAGATPVTVDAALGPAGYAGCVANWRGQSALYQRALRLRVSDGTSGQAVAHLSAGGCAMAEMLPTTREHFVLVYEASQPGTYTALDPWPGEHGQEREFNVNEAQSWRIVSHIPPPLQDIPRISLHLQSMVPGIESFLQTAKPGAIKRVTGMEDLMTMKRWAPKTASVYRHYADQNGYLDDPDGDRAGRRWIDQFEHSLRSVCASGLWTYADPLYVEAWNELGWAAGNLDSIAKANNIERGFVRQLMALGLPVAPVTFCAGVGNIGRPGLEEQDFLLLVDLARETQAAGGCFGLHAYWTPGKLIENWKYLAGRFEWIDEVLVRNGVHVKWMLGEGGNAGERDNPTPLDRTGWRAPNAYNGDWDAYQADILECNRRLQRWNDTHGNRCLVLTLFTTGDMGSWPTFTIETPQINALAQALIM